MFGKVLEAYDQERAREKSVRKQLVLTTMKDNLVAELDTDHFCTKYKTAFILQRNHEVLYNNAGERNIHLVHL